MVEGLVIIIITGLWGTGKSLAIRALEDNGFFCVDNLPALLIPKFIDLCQGYQEEIRRIGLGVDLRGGAQFWQALQSIRALADRVIDTSDFNVHQLRREIEQQFCQAPQGRRLSLFFTSFGYKFGIPHDTDMILDVRFLPNPYFVNELRPRSGLEPADKEYVLGNVETRMFLDRLYALLEFALPLYDREGKSSLTLALGCTGGRHRSVVLVEQLRKRFGANFPVHIKHRDIDK